MCGRSQSKHVGQVEVLGLSESHSVVDSVESLWSESDSLGGMIRFNQHVVLEGGLGRFVFGSWHGYHHA